MTSTIYSLKVLLLVVSLVFCTTSSQAFASENYILVSSKKHGELKHKHLKIYLSGQKTIWPDGSPVVILLFPKGSKEMKWLCKNIINMPENLYRRFVMQKAFRSGLKLLEVKDQQQAIRALKENHGAIAPISPRSITSELIPILSTE